MISKYAILGLCTFTIATNFIWATAFHKEKVARVSAESHRDRLLSDALEHRIAFESAARVKEREMRDAMALLDEQYRNKLNEIERSKDSIISDLESGNRRLREHWQACSDNTGVSKDSIAEQGFVDKEKLQRESAGRIVREVDQCELQVNSLIDYINNVVVNYNKELTK